MDNKDFNIRIKKLREKKGLSQDELANLSGLSLRTIQRIERNETNPLGDTKRKILKILKSYPDADFNSEPEPKMIEKDDFLNTLMIKYQYLLILNIFSLLLISVGLSGLEGFLFFGLVVGFLSLVLLSMSAVYHLKKQGFKRGFKYLTFSLTSILIYFFIVSWFIPFKTVQNTTINGVTTRIDRNPITGKTDTAIIKDKSVVNYK